MKIKFVALLLASSVIAGAPSSAQPARQADTTDASLPTQLPRTAVPHHYAIIVTPHAERLSFDATVAIDLEVIKPTREIVLNAADLTFASASLRPARGGAALRGQVTLDAEAQTAKIAFPATLAAGAYRLELVYSGKINTQANGLFALDYDTAAGKRRALFTQFENSDARRFVPSWDEPAKLTEWDSPHPRALFAESELTSLRSLTVAQDPRIMLDARDDADREPTASL